MRSLVIIGVAALSVTLAACHDAVSPPTAIVSSGGTAAATATVAMLDLGPGTAQKINNRGQVIGQDARAFLWEDGVRLDLGSLDGGRSRAADINEAGRIAGTSYAASSSCIYPTVCAGARAFLWDGAMHDLGTIDGADFSEAIAISPQGHVVGFSGTASAFTFRAFLWDGAMHDLGTLGGARSWANAEDAGGRVVGGSVTATGETHAFAWVRGTMTDLGTLGGDYSEALGVNARGEIVGISTLAGPDYVIHAVLWKAGTITDLGTLECSFAGSLCDWSVAGDINARGEIVGYSGVLGSQPVLWDRGGIENLGTLGGADGEARAINARGDIVGLAAVAGGGGSCTAPAGCHGFYWDGMTMYDLPSFADPTFPESAAYGLNEHGQVVGYSLNNGTERRSHAVLWTIGH